MFVLASSSLINFEWDMIWSLNQGISLNETNWGWNGKWIRPSGEILRSGKIGKMIRQIFSYCTSNPTQQCWWFEMDIWPWKKNNNDQTMTKGHRRIDPWSIVCRQPSIFWAKNWCILAIPSMNCASLFSLTLLPLRISLWLELCTIFYLWG